MSAAAAPAGSIELPGPLTLESGARLPSVTMAFRTWGRPAADGGNAVLVCHALTGSADVDRWWGALLGAGRALDPDRDFVVCSNVLGGCYGTTGPTSPRPGGQGRWGGDFPAVTVRDIVRVQAALLDALGVGRLRLVVGGSLGGMQVLEWALLFPDRVEAIAPIAVSARHSAWSIGLSEAQRQAIYADPRWRDGRYPEGDGPDAGLAVARQIAMCTYRSRASLEARFSRAEAEAGGFAVEGWLRHHGRALVDRFDASTYVTLTKAMERTTWATDGAGGARPSPRFGCRPSSSRSTRTCSTRRSSRKRWRTRPASRAAGQDRLAPRARCVPDRGRGHEHARGTVPPGHRERQRTRGGNVGGLKRRVLKFGGTSVGTAAALRSALEIAETAARERPVVIVVSALAGVTNALEAALAGAAASRLDIAGFASAIRERHLALLATVAPGKPALRAGAAVRARVAELESRLRAVSADGGASAAARASVLALGERLSVPIVEAALRGRGLEACAVDAASLVRTDASFAEATVDYPATRRLARAAFGALGLGAVPVVTGFLGSTEAGETTLLGRGGSDLTAAVLGWALDAERVEIWSDVDGVMTADPRLVPAAETLPRLTYAEATELARGGAKVLHPRTLEPLEGAGIPVYVGNTLRPNAPGTWIGPADATAEEAGTAA